MYPINDREFLKICADIASLMSISLASAKKKVEIQITNNACKTIDEKRKVAKEVYDLCKKESTNKYNSIKLFDDLMQSSAGNDNFLVED
tara:strand:+ start:1261 stop:1527 length:267 start_codon:yes stop_codon:yes gene_type:complete